MNPTELRSTLKTMDLHPSRKLGQNFMADENTARAIVDALGAGPDACVVEVGPGLGALTEHLVGKVRRLVLIEFDVRLAERLADLHAGRDDVDVIQADAARFDPRAFYQEGPVHFLGNLPYSAGGAILANFFRHPTPVGSGLVLLQKEFVDRMVASPRSKDYGLLSVRLQSAWKVKRLREIGPDVFVPRPKVASTLAEITPLPPGTWPVHDAALLDRIVRCGFAQRRKQLHRQLPLHDKSWPEIADSIGVTRTARAEELSIAQWIALARLLDTHPLRDIPQRDEEIFDVVDENDVVTGQEQRAIVHARGLLHRATHVFVFNRNGDLLLQKRSHMKDTNPGRWDSSAAGHLDSGEDYAPAAAREVDEELGMQVDALEEIARLRPCEETGWEHVALFRATGKGKPSPPCSEVEQLLWLPTTEVEAWTSRRPEDFASGFLACWKAWKEATESET